MAKDDENRGFHLFLPKAEPNRPKAAFQAKPAYRRFLGGLLRKLAEGADRRCFGIGQAGLFLPPLRAAGV